MTKDAKLFRFTAWTGPTVVKAVAEGFRKAGAVDVLEGTENIYWTYSGDTADEARERTQQALIRNGNTFGIGIRGMRLI